jgi:hypothetical protein
MRKRYVILAACLALLSCGITWGLYLYNKPHANVARQSPSFRMDAADLGGEYRRDEAGSNRKFIDKVIEVKGTISDQQQTDSTASIQLDTGDPGSSVNCSFLLTGQAKMNLLPKGSQVTIKGRCAGMLIDVNLVDCVME